MRNHDGNLHVRKINIDTLQLYHIYCHTCKHRLVIIVVYDPNCEFNRYFCPTLIEYTIHTNLYVNNTALNSGRKSISSMQYQN